VEPGSISSKTGGKKTLFLILNDLADTVYVPDKTSLKGKLSRRSTRAAVRGVPN
jgi:hypothetical protein